MADAALKKLEDQLNCPVCLDTYTNPKQLQCHHIYCQQCLRKLVERDQQGQLIVTCPNCRQVTPVPANGVAGLQTAFQTNHLLDILKEQKKAKEGVLYCADHQERELELYCESCEQLICFQCTITEHRSHNYSLVKDIFEKHKQEIKTSLAPAKERLSAVRKASKCIQALKNEVLNRQGTLESKIYDDNRKLVDIITARTSEHIDKLRQITEEKVRDLESQVEQLDTIETQLSSGVDMVEETLTTGTPVKVVSIKTAIARQVEELITSLQTDTLEPVTQADMEYSIDSDVLEMCQSYGKVCSLGSPDPSMCRATGKGLEEATVGKKSSAILQAVNLKGQPLKEPIRSSECELVSDITGSSTKGNVERRGQSQYEINYQPTIKGRHQLHVKVEGQHIRGSPFTIKVTSPVEKLGAPLGTIEGIDSPYDVAINQKGELVVTEWKAHCVSVLSLTGKKLLTFGAPGSTPGRFERPAGITVDFDGSIVVADSGNHRVQKFSADGKFLASANAPGGKEFNWPKGVAYNRVNKKIYVADSDHSRVLVLNSDLTYSSSFGKKGSGKGQLDNAIDVAIDKSGNVYVVDCNNYRIQVFTAEGKFLRLFGKRGGGSGEFKCAFGVAVDSSDMVYVSDVNTHSVSVFTSEGQFVTSFGRKGSGKGEFDAPSRVAVDSCGVVYVADTYNHRIQCF